MITRKDADSKYRWKYSKSARKGYVKKIEGFEEWFYSGPTLHFGHVKKVKKK